MTDSIQIGYLLRSSTTGFVAGCAVAQLDSPAFGALVRAPTGGNSSVYGLIHDMQVADDGLIRQLVTSGNIKPEVMQDNRNHRIVPVEISILTVGCRTASRVSHLLPPRPAISLDVIDLVWLLPAHPAIQGPAHRRPACRPPSTGCLCQREIPE
jgi:hypothetical protein